MDDFIETLHFHFSNSEHEVIIESLEGLCANTQHVAELSYYVPDELILALIKARDKYTAETSFLSGQEQERYKNDPDKLDIF